MPPPEVSITTPGSWVPDNIKVKKKISLLPLPFALSGTAKWNLHDGKVSLKYSCKDLIFRGKLHLNPSEHTVEYTKPFSVPIAGFRLGSLVLRAAWKYSEGAQRHALSYNVGFELRRGTMVRPNSMQFKPYVGLNRVGIEARTLVTLIMPSHLLFEVSGDSLMPHRQSTGQQGDDDEPFGINIDVQELNVVVRV